MLNFLFVIFFTGLILGQRALTVRNLYAGVEQSDGEEYDYR